MQTLTFTQKLLRQRNLFNFLIPLFAIFIGLGSTQNAFAQGPQIDDGEVIFTAMPTGSGATTTVHYATPGSADAPYVDYLLLGTANPTNPAPNLGAFDISGTGTSSLVLTGSSLVAEPLVTRIGRIYTTYTATAARLRYRTYLVGTPVANQPSFSVVTLNNAGPFPAFPTATLFNTTTNINLLGGLLSGGNYITEASFDVDYSNGTTLQASGNPYSALFTLAAPPVSTAMLRNVIVTSGTTAANATTNTYDATATTPGPGVFNGTDFGVLDAGTGQLLLQGGSIQIAEKNGDKFDAASITFVVSPGTLASPSAGFGSGQTLTLVQSGYNTATMTRTFSLSNAARNILALAMTGGAGTSYRFDVTVAASGMNAGFQPISILGPRQNSVFTVTGTPVFMPTLTGTTVFIAPSNGPNVTYDANNVSANPNFDGANLGTFDIVNGQLVLNGGGATTNENGPNQISNVTLYFRVRQTGTGGGGYTPLALTQTNLTTNADGSRTRTFVLDNAAQNLLAAVTTVGGYNVDAYLEASGANTATGSFFVITDRSNVAPYTANFTVNGTPIVTTVWTGGLNDNWFDTLNWTNGVPTAIKNAVIPNFTSGSAKPYPNIYSDVVKPVTPQSTSTNPDGTTDIIPESPGYDNRGSGNAIVRNLTLQGSTQLDRSILRLIRGRLDVFGDFSNPQGSFIQRGTTVISFKASGNQSISGSSNGFTDVEIDGGVNSIKTLVNSFTVKSGGSLKFINGILQTNITMVSTNFVTFEGLTTNVTTSVTLPAAQLLGETETSWFRGFLTTTQLAVPNIAQNFSNIGMTLTFTDNDPGNTTVTRNTADNYPQTSFAGSTQNPNANPKPSIRRVFGVQPNNPATQTRSLTADVAFRYLSNELVGVRTFNGDTATTNLNQNKLSLYVSSTGGDGFNQLGRESNSGNILFKRGVTTFSTFTLSEAAMLPLPVTLTSFDAKRVGDDALVAWETASEINSKGYNVQVSTDGKSFRTVGFVASVSANNVVAKSYSFTDTEKNKVGVRYYRLEQLDLDGKTAFFAPRAVTFEGRATASGVLAYPNPFTNEVRLNLTSATEGNALVRISDMTGRVVGQRQIVLIKGANDVEVTSVSDLKGGLYLLNVALPNGETKTMKVVKQ
jgi:hypothetical protein